MADQIFIYPARNRAFVQYNVDKIAQNQALILRQKQQLKELNENIRNLEIIEQTIEDTLNITGEFTNPIGVAGATLHLIDLRSKIEERNKVSLEVFSTQARLNYIQDRNRILTQLANEILQTGEFPRGNVLERLNADELAALEAFFERVQPRAVVIMPPMHLRDP